MLLGNVVDKLHDEHRFADARAAEQTDLAAFGIGAEQVDDLDAGLQNFGRGGQLVKRGRQSVDVPPLGIFRRRLVVHGITQHVENSAERFLAHRHADGIARIGDGGVARQTVGGVHRDAARGVVTDVLRHLHRQGAFADRHGQSVIQRRQLAVFKPHVDNRSHDLYHAAVCFFRHWSFLLF